MKKAWILALLLALVLSACSLVRLVSPATTSVPVPFSEPPKAGMIRPTATIPTHTPIPILSFIPTTPQPILENRGNTGGNIANGSCAVEYKGLIYLASDFNPRGIYVFAPGFRIIKKISSDAVGNLNIVDGWIYYTDNLSKDRWSIYKMKIDGSQKKKLNSESSGNVTVIDDWIYYMASDPGKFEYNRIFKIKTDGTHRTCLLKKSEIESISVEDGWVYFNYYTNEDGFSPICRIRTDGLDEQVIYKGECDYFFVQNNRVYFHNTANDIGMLNTDGTGLTLITKGSVSNLNLSGDWLYFSSPAAECDEDEWYMYRVKTDGTNLQQLNKEESSLMNVVGDWVVYMTSNFLSDPQTDQICWLMKMKLDGSQRAELGFRTSH